MDQIVDYNGLLEQFSRSVVRIIIYYQGTNPHNSRKEWLPKYTRTGIVTVSCSTFCHIVVCKRKFFDGSRYRYVLFFPDKTYVNLIINENMVQKSDWLAAFFVPTTGKKVEAVQFNKQNVELREKVWAFGYDHYSNRLLDKGSVTHIGNGKFDHDCPPNSYTAYGFPVFTLDKNLAGISYFDYGVTRALNVKGMTHMLSTMFDGMTEKPLVEILERIKALGEAEYGDPSGKPLT